MDYTYNMENFSRFDVSVIMPVLNEENFIETSLLQIRSLLNEGIKEIIIVDGGSTDKTAKIASEYGIVISSDPGRGLQCNAGAEIASGKVLFFVHADMIVPSNAIKMIRFAIRQGYGGGGFANEFIRFNNTIRIVSRVLNLQFRNPDRADNKTMFGDNGLFVKRSLFLEMSGFQDIPIMEDYEFMKRLNRAYPIIRIKEPRLILSSRRHEEQGVFRTCFKWMLINRLYNFGIKPEVLARLYT